MHNRRPPLPPRPDTNPIGPVRNKQILLTEKAYELRCKYKHQTSRPMKLKQTLKWRRARIWYAEKRDDRLRRTVVKIIMLCLLSAGHYAMAFMLSKSTNKNRHQSLSRIVRSLSA